MGKGWGGAVPPHPHSGPVVSPFRLSWEGGGRANVLQGSPDLSHPLASLTLHSHIPWAFLSSSVKWADARAV